MGVVIRFRVPIEMHALCPDCLKIIQDMNERVYTVPGMYWNTRYPDCVKNIQEVNERVYAVLGKHWNALYPDCLKIIQDVNERVYTVPGMYWNTWYPDFVRNIHVVNGRGYTLPGTRWNALCHCLQLVPGIFTLAGQVLPPYQVASLAIQPFGHNRYGPKIGGERLCPFGEGELVII